MDEQDKLRLEPQLRRTVVAEGQSVFKMGDAAKHLYIIRKGKVCASLDMILFVARHGETFGEEGLFDPLEVYGFSVKALERTELVMLPIAACLGLFKANRNAAILFKLLKVANARLNRSFVRVLDTASLSIISVARLLYDYVETGEYDMTPEGMRINEKLTEPFIIDRCGYARSTIVRALSNLTENGIIRKHRSRITILNADKLRQIFLKY